jgi:crotonobetainyl-CoA:carnitine CoA-transferase CaiB-like acyl-CoA transferase
MRVSKSLAARAWGTVRSRRPGSAEKEGDTDMATALLDGIRVVDLSGEPAALTGRILADLGAAVVLVEPPGGHPLRSDPDRFAAWSAGKTSLSVQHADDPTLLDLLASADIVVATPGFPGTLDVDAGRAPQAVWVSVTPFGRSGPRSGWVASDLGVMAASANMYCTGDPDRPPVRCTEPSGYAHTGPETAFAALTALWTGRPQHVDVSMQEVVFVANMGTPARYPSSHFRGVRRGANIGRTREIWPTKDGFVSFGLRGGKARVPSLELITRLVREAGVDASALEAQDWSAWAPNTADESVLRAIEAPIAEYFAGHTMQELYDVACETNLMLAPANSPREILASRQLAARGFFSKLGDVDRFPTSFVQVRAATGAVSRVSPGQPAPALPPSAPVVNWSARPRSAIGSPARTRGPAWEGTNILEFGSGAAGPIATRYFAEHGATVLRVESRTRPDFLRVYALGPDNPHGLEGAPMYDALNVGKRNVALNLKHPDAVALVRRLVCEWADAVAENFAPRAMKGFGLDYDSLATLKPDLVMISACLNGQTGPHKDYPGFGGQGAALSGFNWLTGWPDREPLGPHGTITDSLAPRFVATALAAGLEYRRRTGSGVYLDVAQVETGVFALSPWLLAFQRDGTVGVRDGNRSRRAVPHGAFPCAAEDDVGDRWVAVAAWTDEQWVRLADVIGIDDPSLATLPERLTRVEEIEAAISSWTASRSRAEVCERLQAAKVEAVPVADFGDVHDDPQVACREHFVPLVHPVMGPGLYERNGFRLSDAPSGYDRSGPTLGQDNDWVLGEILGLTEAEQHRLREVGAVE